MRDICYGACRQQCRRPHGRAAAPRPRGARARASAALPARRRRPPRPPQDKARPRPFAIVNRVIRRELGASAEEVFSEFSAEATAAASLAQVCVACFLHVWSGGGYGCSRAWRGPLGARRRAPLRRVRRTCWDPLAPAAGPQAPTPAPPRPAACRARAHTCRCTRRGCTAAARWPSRSSTPASGAARPRARLTQGFGGHSQSQRPPPTPRAPRRRGAPGLAPALGFCRTPPATPASNLDLNGRGSARVPQGRCGRGHVYAVAAVPLHH